MTADFEGSWQDAILDMAENGVDVSDATAQTALGAIETATEAVAATVTAGVVADAVFAADSALGVAAVDAANAAEVELPATSIDLAVINDSTADTINVSLDGGTSYFALSAGEQYSGNIAVSSVLLYGSNQPAYRVLASYKAVAA